MEKITINNTLVKIKLEKAFPNRFSWECPKCKNWNRYFELACPYCEWETNYTYIPVLNTYLQKVL